MSEQQKPEEQKSPLWMVEKVPFLQKEPSDEIVALSQGKFLNEATILGISGTDLVLRFRNTTFSLSLPILQGLMLKAIIQDPRCPQKQMILAPSSSLHL